MSHDEVVSFIGDVMDRDHRNLAECLNLIVRLLAEGPERPEAERHQKLRHLVTFLTRRGRQHYNLEERIGELSFVLDDKPWIDADGKQIRKGHKKLQKRLEHIAQTGRALDIQKPATFAKLEAEIQAFREELEQHEEKATRIILDAYNLDIGGRG